MIKIFAILMLIFCAEISITIFDEEDEREKDEESIQEFSSEESK